MLTLFAPQSLWSAVEEDSGSAWIWLQVCVCYLHVRYMYMSGTFHMELT